MEHNGRHDNYRLITQRSNLTISATGDVTPTVAPRQPDPISRKNRIELVAVFGIGVCTAMNVVLNCLRRPRNRVCQPKNKIIKIISHENKIIGKSLIFVFTFDNTEVECAGCDLCCDPPLGGAIKFLFKIYFYDPSSSTSEVSVIIKAYWGHSLN